MCSAKVDLNRKLNYVPLIGGTKQLIEIKFMEIKPFVNQEEGEEKTEEEKTEEESGGEAEV